MSLCEKCNGQINYDTLKCECCGTQYIPVQGELIPAEKVKRIIHNGHEVKRVIHHDNVIWVKEGEVI